MKPLALSVAAFLALATPALALDLSSGATDLTSVGLSGYWGLRVDCDHSQNAALTLAVNPQYEPMVVPTDGNPMAGRANTSPSTDPARDYVLVIWTDTHANPPSGDGQPSWPSTCVQSNTAGSMALIGVVSGVPIGCSDGNC